MQKEEIKSSIISILFILLVLSGLILLLSISFRPTKWLERSRDAHRVEDMTELANALNIYLADNKNFDLLADGKIYRSNTNTQTNGQGWLPLNIKSISSGAPFSKLPTDPSNKNGFEYRVGINKEKKTFEIDCALEYGSNQPKMLTDNGNSPTRYEVGTDLTILK